MPADDVIGLLEVVKLVAEEYGIPTRELKPCIAQLLDGNLGGAARHDAAFVIAVEMRDVLGDYERVRAVLERFATKVGPGFGAARIRYALESGYATKPTGGWKYSRPGLRGGAPGRRYASVLGETCETVGCPQYCPPLASLYQGSREHTYDMFVRLGWRRALNRAGHPSAAPVYAAIVERERQIGAADGSKIHVTFGQLAEIASVAKSTVGRSLDELAKHRLIHFERGSGSGPSARDRKASLVQRVIPLPEVPPIRTGSATRPYLGATGAQR